MASLWERASTTRIVTCDHAPLMQMGTPDGDPLSWGVLGPAHSLLCHVMLCYVMFAVLLYPSIPKYKGSGCGSRDLTRTKAWGATAGTRVLVSVLTLASRGSNPCTRRSRPGRGCLPVMISPLESVYVPPASLSLSLCVCPPECTVAPFCACPFCAERERRARIRPRNPRPLPAVH